MNLCDNCEKKRSGSCKGNEPWEVIVSCGAYKKPPTNADRIRAMSDEELARKFNAIESCGLLYGPYGVKGWLDWLKSTVEVGEWK